MKGSALTPLMRIALGLEVLGFVVYSVNPRQGAGWAFGIAAVVLAVAIDTLANSSARQLANAVEGAKPGLLASYSVTGWRPFVTNPSRVAWRVAHDPALLGVPDLQLDLQRVREMIPLGVAASVIVVVFLLSRIWLA